MRPKGMRLASRERSGMRRTIAQLCVAAALLAVFLGCAQRLTQENLDKVREGMTPAEVKAILGTPTETGTREVPILGKLDRLTYRQGQSEVNLLFHNNSLKIKSGALTAQ
jgi:SmpA / OmlA family